MHVKKHIRKLWTMQRQRAFSPIRGCLCLLAGWFLVSLPALADTRFVSTNTFLPESTPARDIYYLALFALTVTGSVFVVVAALLFYATFKFRARKTDPDHEPAQVYGSTQVELAWTVIPIIIIVVLFLTTSRIIFAIQDAPQPKDDLKVTVVGHQFWWEFRYPEYGIVTANELHVPLSTDQHPDTTYLTLLSADVDHSFWVPELAGKTDLIPNHPNEMWMDPQKAGIYYGQCAQFCGVEHSKMLIRVYVDTPAQFQSWVQNQQKPAVDDPSVAAGKNIFMTEACVNCHTITGTQAKGTYGPDLTHLMSRDTIASGSVQNTPADLRAWIKDPATFKPGCHMPAMQLSDQQIDQVVAYLTTLH